jgi:hypothetical protein
LGAVATVSGVVVSGVVVSGIVVSGIVAIGDRHRYRRSPWRYRPTTMIPPPSPGSPLD